MNIKITLGISFLFVLIVIRTNAQFVDSIKIGTVTDSVYRKLKTVFLPPIYYTPCLNSSEPSKHSESECIGRGMSTNIDFLKTASLIFRTKEELTYLLYIYSPNAAALSFRFSTLKLPENAELSIENEVRDTIYVKYIGIIEKGIDKNYDPRTIRTNKAYIRLKVKKGMEKDCNIVIGTISQDWKQWWKE